MQRTLIPSVLAAALFTFTALAAAEFSIQWSSIDGGGGDSSGATYDLAGVIGQHDAGAAASSSWSLSGGYIGGATTAPPCPGDLDGSGDVGFGDLLAVLAAWGPCAGCPEDLDGSGDVGFNDLLAILAAWGAC